MVALSTLLWTSAKPIIKFLVLGGCGAVMAKHGLLTPAGAKVVAGLILNYTLPALLFAKMLTCVSQDNVEELGFVALVAVLYIAMGALLGLLIQRTGLVPKRLYWGIVAATMFTNFGDLPISIILAVSDHPPFLVGDGARGTAYSSVFISVFYLFLFPLGGYRLIRYDHVKESKRLHNLNAALREHDPHHTDINNEGQGEMEQPSPNASDCTLSEDTLTAHPELAQHHHKQQQQKQQQQQQHYQKQNQHLSSPGQMRQQENGLQSSFSATSTMISMDYVVEDHAKELRYRPQEHELSSSPRAMMSSPRDQHEDSIMSSSSPSREQNPFINMPMNSGSSGSSSRSNSSSSGDHSSPSYGHPHHQHPHHPQPPYPLQILKSDIPRYSVESMISNGTAATRFSTGHDDDDHLIQPMARAVTTPGSSASRKKSLRSPLFKGYQPPPLGHSQGNTTPLGGSNNPGSTSFSPSSRSNSLTPSNSVSPTLAPTSPSGSRMPSPESGGKLNCSTNQMPEVMAVVSLDPTLAPTTIIVTPGGESIVISTEPLPKVPPALSKSYNSNHTQHVHWFWRMFHSTREYLTPPTIGLILGLLAALTPLRGLFVPVANPLPSPDELPPLSFILEITLMLGGCCVPLGLTVLGASLSRLKPGRMRPLIPVMTMITVAKLVISPFIGIMLVQFVMVRHYGWVSSQNNMLQFTLMLMSGSPTSITCFVLAQVWDRRTKNAGSEMAALIAVQYAVSTVLLTVGSAFMMYFLF